MTTKSTDTTAEAPVAPVRPQHARAVRALVGRIVEAWREQDAEKFSQVYAADASVVLPGALIKGRPAIRDYMAAAFRGKWKGTEVLGVPKELRYLGGNEEIVLLVSEGGAYPPGATEVPAEHAIRAMWFFAERDGEWAVDSYANTPLDGVVPMPAARG
ncbi:SgcJ/EcaC family oxidoreductase [Streptomyces sp. NPDC007088]|uniref:SgcJ/EcaC family oxidoreductase n=1 Tax=Streptomyces sp. NPDC007088 TaxID=3364773 RepID=UPI0036811982